jgi:hypothetical protein
MAKNKIMEKVLTNELRWLHRDNKIVLQQRWYWEWSNNYTWEDVPSVIVKSDNIQGHREDSTVL